MATQNNHSEASGHSVIKSITGVESSGKGQHYLVVSSDRNEFPCIEHPSECPTEVVLLGNDEVEYMVYRCSVSDDDYDLEDYFDTKNLAPGKYPIEAWGSKTWTDYGWEYDGGLVFSAEDQVKTAASTGSKQAEGVGNATELTNKGADDEQDV